jgi:hypothetical protein
MYVPTEAEIIILDEDSVDEYAADETYIGLPLVHVYGIKLGEDTDWIAGAAPILEKAECGFDEAWFVCRDMSDARKVAHRGNDRADQRAHEATEESRKRGLEMFK